MRGLISASSHSATAVMISSAEGSPCGEALSGADGGSACSRSTSGASPSSIKSRSSSFSAVRRPITTRSRLRSAPERQRVPMRMQPSAHHRVRSTSQ